MKCYGLEMCFNWLVLYHVQGKREGSTGYLFKMDGYVKLNYISWTHMQRCYVYNLFIMNTKSIKHCKYDCWISKQWDIYEDVYTIGSTE